MAVQVVSFHCVLKDKKGQVIGTSFNKDVIVAPTPNDENLRGLVEGMQGIQAGERRSLSLRADEAYGFYDPRLVLQCPREQLQVNRAPKVGDMMMHLQQGAHRLYRVTEIHMDSVTLDANHPLAGQDLVFEIEAIKARDATSDDLNAEVPQILNATTMLH